MPEKVIAIFDIGRTNKKFFLFNQQYQIILEESSSPEDILDEDGVPCEDISLLTNWVNQTLNRFLSEEKYTIVAVNFSAHGAGLVHVDDLGKPLTHLYSYLKPLEEGVQDSFNSLVEKYSLSEETASPAMGMLNAGLQLYRLKRVKPELFSKIKYSFHLPQYCSWLLHKCPVSEITSLGCHTSMWDFRKNDYHSWVYDEELHGKLPPLFDSSHRIKSERLGNFFETGMGLHDSSSALVPYLVAFDRPFLLVSTGTWSITLNPFNHEPLQKEELEKDCLCYLNYKGKPVKASRLFLGNEHEHQVKKLSDYFKKQDDYYKQVEFDKDLFKEILNYPSEYTFSPETMEGNGPFKKYPGQYLNPQQYSNFEEAYHHLIFGLVSLQMRCIDLAKGKTNVSQIFVDGGFSKNKLFLKMLALRLPDYKVYSAKLPQATAAGAALVMDLKEEGFDCSKSQLIEMELQ